MLVKDCKKCRYSKINQEVKDIFMYINHGTTPWFNICKKKVGNEELKDIYCMTSGVDLDLTVALKAYEEFLKEKQNERE